MIRKTSNNMSPGLEIIASDVLDDSIRILFWNIHKHDLSAEITLLASDLSADVVILLEHDGYADSILHRLQQTMDVSFAIPPQANAKFLVISRISAPAFEEVFFAPRFSVRRFRMRQGCALLAIFHGLDPVNYDIETRSCFAREKARDLREVMKANETHSAIVIGDFNLNPFDSVMNQPQGFNAMMTKSCVVKGSRRFCKNDYDFFYNPMWGFLGDLDSSASGSIYYTGSRGQYGWNMFDQILVHHSLVPSLLDVKIIHKHHCIALGNTRGRPNLQLSDHFPLFATIAR